MEPFKRFIETYTELPDADWNRIVGCFEKTSIRKNELLLREGQVCRHLYFLETGLLRYFLIKDGDDITKFFTVAPYCFTSQVSFTSEKPAKESIQALEPSVVWLTTLRQANELLALPSWNTFVRKLIQEVQYFTEELLQALQTETAEQRYEKMLRTNPALLQRIPLKYLATYFGIAPQSLSRIRKKLSQADRS
ncbi:Crp/Fnr family transcriptional regulator [Larkinella sp. VNQ87]|uniref:Crp/Fnr family transcriptional regulator n=1 Tax=Larkinella sp. VNQ87 TaxID=3400921 RepID=UPI003BFCC430